MRMAAEESLQTIERVDASLDEDEENGGGDALVDVTQDVASNDVDSPAGT